MSDQDIDIENSNNIPPNSVTDICDAIREFKNELAVNHNNNLCNKSGLGGDHEALFNVMLFGIQISSDKLDEYLTRG